MPNRRETNTNEKVDKFSEALEAARKMQQNWLNYGLDFVHLYVEDVHGDWLEKWGDDEPEVENEALVTPRVGSSVLNSIKAFLVSDDDVAVSVRQILGERSLFDVAVNLEEFLNLPDANDRLYAVRNLLAGREQDNTELLDLADSLLEKLALIL